MNTGAPVLFRCDGSPTIGLGHVVRCLALADELSEVYQCRVSFAMRCGPLGFEMVQKKGYRVFTSPESGQPFNYAHWLEEVIQRFCASVLVLDVRDDLPVEAVQAIRGQGIPVVTLDDPSERRIATDLAFYPPVPQVHKIDWSGFTGQLYVGWEWVVLRREFSQRLPKVNRGRPMILVTMGGSDPAGLTMKTIRALETLDEEFETTVVLGPGFLHQDALMTIIASCHRRFNLRKDVRDFADLIAQADLAVISFGVTAYELAAMGVPSVQLCLTQDHAESALAFVEAGMALCPGVYTQVTSEMLIDHVRYLLNDRSRRLIMAEHARRKVDGRGAMRIANRIAERLRNTNG